MRSTELLLSAELLQPRLEFTQATQPVNFFDLQPRASSAIRQFLQNSHRTLLMLKVDDLAEYANAVENFVELNQALKSDIFGVHYLIEQADSFSFPKISAQPATSHADNFASQKKVATALYFDQNQLLGSIRIHPSSKDIQLNSGLVHQVNGGILILSLAGLLRQFDLWERLKHILMTKHFDWYSAHPFKALPCDIPSFPLNLKVILLGNREELATFSELETGLYQWADYAEIESYFSLENEQNQQGWANYVRCLGEQQKLTLSENAIEKLYQLFVRESEERGLVSISPRVLTDWISSAGFNQPNSILSAVDFEQAFQQKQYQQGFLQERTYSDILNEQIYIDTDGEVVGQINGLSVIEYPGTPVCFGEPSRLSCIVQFGDGEVIDIERKSDLAGNLHGKGMMIAQACLSHLFDFPSQLPFSASLVFEQSYGEIDGDSASLAACCVLLSALSDLPLPQSIAITGTIDQFGLVHSVGGVNSKIEGFFDICKSRGLTGKQGVIIPTTVIHQLSLTDEVKSAVENQQFFIWAVEDIHQTCEILFERDLLEQEGKSYKNNELPLNQVISKRIEQYSEAERSSVPIWLKWFTKK
ncbi:MAG: Lon protease family protein [Lonepinella koalarum]|nr:Lon protease family protein [Lonepinella koalarum]